MARLRHLVVMIPGIGGSVLETTGGSPVWGQRPRALASALIDPARLSLAEHPILRPVALLPSTRVLSWQVVAGYDYLVDQVRNAFGLGDDDVDMARDGAARKPGASLVLFVLRAGTGSVRYAPSDRRQLGGTRGPARPDVLALFARGHATPESSGDSWRQGARDETDAEWLPNAGWRGDGTVPAISAYPIELSSDPLARRAVPDRHGPMALSSTTVDVLREYEAESTASLRGDAPEGPWLGLDLDGVTAAGEPFPVTAELLGSADIKGASAWLQIKPDGDTATAPAVRMIKENGRWRATVPGLAPGAYRITIEALNVPVVDRVTVGGRDVVGVIEP